MLTPRIGTGRRRERATESSVPSPLSTTTRSAGVSLVKAGRPGESPRKRRMASSRTASTPRRSSHSSSSAAVRRASWLAAFATTPTRRNGWPSAGAPGSFISSILWGRWGVLAPEERQRLDVALGAMHRRVHDAQRREAEGGDLVHAARDDFGAQGLVADDPALAHRPATDLELRLDQHQQ